MLLGDFFEFFEKLFHFLEKIFEKYFFNITS